MTPVHEVSGENLVPHWWPSSDCKLTCGKGSGSSLEPLISFTWPPPSWPHYSPKSQPLIASPWGLEFQHINFKGTQTFNLKQWVLGSVLSCKASFPEDTSFSFVSFCFLFQNSYLYLFIECWERTMAEISNVAPFNCLDSLAFDTPDHVSSPCQASDRFLSPLFLRTLSLEFIQTLLFKTTNF